MCPGKMDKSLGPKGQKEPLDSARRLSLDQQGAGGRPKVVRYLEVLPGGANLAYGQESISLSHSKATERREETLTQGC